MSRLFHNYFKESYSRWFTALIIGFFITMYCFEFINGRLWLNDFKVFYEACGALLANEQVYGKYFGLQTGFYKYSPETLLFFIPFAAMPFNVALSVYFLFLSICSSVLIKTITDFCFPKLNYQIKKLGIALFLFLSVTVHLIRELHLGNTNLLLLLLCFVIFKYAGKRDNMTGFILAFVILTKPYFALLFLPLALNGKWKTILKSGFSVVGLIAILCIVVGIDNASLIHQNWIQSIQAHSNYLTSSHNIDSLLYALTGFSMGTKTAMLLLIVSNILLFLAYWISNGLNNFFELNSIAPSVRDKKYYVHYFLTIALVPCFLITDTEHFLFVLPLIGFMVKELLQMKKYAIGIGSIFLTAWFLIASFGNDLWGADLFSLLSKSGVLGIGTLTISALALFYSFKMDSPQAKYHPTV